MTMKQSFPILNFKTFLLLFGLFCLFLSACKPEPFVFNTQIKGKFTVKHQSESFAGEWVVLLLEDKETPCSRHHKRQRCLFEKPRFVPPKRGQGSRAPLRGLGQRPIKQNRQVRSSIDVIVFAVGDCDD